MPENELGSGPFTVHLLDVGSKKYGECILCRFEDTTVLVDGGHAKDYWGQDGYPSIPDQLAEILGQSAPHEIDLLVLTHLHSDHIGCLPTLVRQRIIQPKWALLADIRYGYGWINGGDPRSYREELPRELREMLSLVREERWDESLGEQERREHLAELDAQTDDYMDMVDDLVAMGTEVVIHDGRNHKRVERAFGQIGLKVLGPTPSQLKKTAQEIGDLGRAAKRNWTPPDAAGGPVDPFQLARQWLEADDALGADRPGMGACVNNQSIVLALGTTLGKVLLTGDMQLGKYEFDPIKREMDNLRDRIADHGPYDFVKLSHHGSYNGLDEEHLRDVSQTKLFATQNGLRDKGHPSSSVLKLLQRKNKTWARTDRNGPVTVRVVSEEILMEISRGRFDDPTINTGRDPLPFDGGDVATTVTAGTGRVPQVSTSPTADNFVEVTARIPHVRTRVTLTIDVELVEGRATSKPPQAPVGARSALPSTGAGAGGPQTKRVTPQRLLPPPKPEDRIVPFNRTALNLPDGERLKGLLFVTNRAKLEQRIGAEPVQMILNTLKQAGHHVLDSLNGQELTANAAAAQVIQALPNGCKGVVLLGGYDVVPAQRLDVIPASLRTEVNRKPFDHDDFIVWSDDIYTDRDQGGFPDLPVSRIPDAGSWQLVFNALEAQLPSPPASAFGVHNIKRPFAIEVFKRLGAPPHLLVSEKTTPNDINYQQMSAEGVYFMLHGSYSNCTTYDGERKHSRRCIDAVNNGNVPRRTSGVVFAGCCWGALTVDTIARHATPRTCGRPFAPSESIPLTFLQAGTAAFVGCTGVHYSPTVHPYGYYGGPMHHGFWHRVVKQQLAPAQALHLTKAAYLKGITQRHPKTHYHSIAIELKILRQFTCLGLGW